jgi:YHS domain-containing protein/thiol-disulfide isomerase/thioredoxin
MLGPACQAAPINWRSSLDLAASEANRTGKLILLHFYTSTCGPCKKLERDVFSQPQIAAAIEQNYIPVKLNADNSPAYANRYQITQVPSEVVLTPQGNIVQKLTCPLEPNAYGSQIINVAQHYSQRSLNQMASAQTPINSAYAGLRIESPAQPSVTKASESTKAPLTPPTVMQNPYVKSAPPAAPPRVAQQPPSTPPTASANANAPRYNQRYAAVTAPARPVEQPAPALEVPVAATTTAPAPPVAPPIAAAPPINSAPPINAAPPINTSPPINAAPRIAAAPPAVSAPSLTEQTPSARPSESATKPAPTQQPQIAQTPQVPAAAWPPALPSGTPPLGFEGYCPVSLRDSQKWVRGKATFGAIHRGRTYLFAGDAQRQKFLTTPDAFSPVFSGNDPVMMLDENKQVSGTRKFGFAYRDAFYLFSSKETMSRFASQPDRYSAGVRQAMGRMDAAAGGTIRR